MVIPLIRLDNVFPATWESVWGGIHPEPYDPYLDSESRVRFIDGQDPVNYFTAQRFQGDLFKRDLLQAETSRRIIDYLSARQGYFFNIPSVTLQPDTYIPLGAMMGTDQIEGYYLVAYVCNVDYGLISDIELRIVDQDTGAVLSHFNPTGEQNLVWAVGTSRINNERGKLVDNFEIRLYNKGCEDLVTVQAGVVLSPKINWDGLNASSYSEDTATSISEDTPTPILPEPPTPTSAAPDLLADTVWLDSLWKLMQQRTYPVGELCITRRGGNPSSWLGFGAWELYGQGRAIVGYDPSDSDFNLLDKIGGSKTHTLSINEMPSHNHSILLGAGSVTAAVYNGSNGNVTIADTTSIQNSGGGQAHNNLQPYITVYVWKRIA